MLGFLALVFRSCFFCGNDYMYTTLLEPTVLLLNLKITVFPVD